MGSQSWLYSGQPESTISESIRILIVDDYMSVREMIRDILLDQPQFEIIGEASNGKEAVDLVRQLKPDVVLIDVFMPVLNGIDATRLIKDEFPEIGVLGISINDDQEPYEKMKEAGAYTLINKEASPAMIRSHILLCYNRA